MGKSLGVDSVRATDNETLVREFKRALAEPGPHLIEVML
jgi:thiamine pyrophosphate-dependent acetolactate synthase large subunit-like protein